jgi:putative transposase
MKNNGTSENIIAKTKSNGGALKAHDQGNKHKVAPVAAVRNHDRSRVYQSPQLKNLVWSYHLITVLTAKGRDITILTIFDEHTKECLYSLAANHITTENVIDDLFNLFLHRGIPKYLIAFTDNNSMPSSICEWLEKLELTSTFVELKKYGENGYGVLFKDKFVKDLLNERSFASLADVQLWAANWMYQHNRSVNLARS